MLANAGYALSLYSERASTTIYGLIGLILGDGLYSLNGDLLDRLPAVSKAFVHPEWNGARSTLTADSQKQAVSN